MKKNLKRLLASWHEFHLADKCLLIIMSILLIQTAHNLFFQEITLQDSAPLDVVIRTTTAAIFGYFISGNFHSSNKNGRRNNNDNENFPEIKLSSDISSHSAANTLPNIDLEIQELNDEHKSHIKNIESIPENKGQIIIVSAVGIVCLVLLLIARNYTAMTPSSTAALSQLRDFISGSVGFLIGQSTQHKKSS